MSSDSNTSRPSTPWGKFDAATLAKAEAALRAVRARTGRTLPTPSPERLETLAVTVAHLEKLYEAGLDNAKALLDVLSARNVGSKSVYIALAIAHGQMRAIATLDGSASPFDAEIEAMMEDVAYEHARHSLLARAGLDDSADPETAKAALDALLERLKAEKKGEPE